MLGQLLNNIENHFFAALARKYGMDLPDGAGRPIPPLPLWVTREGDYLTLITVEGDVLWHGRLSE